MAGVMALINQKAGSAQGNPNAELYVLAGKQTYASCSAETSHRVSPVATSMTSTPEPTRCHALRVRRTVRCAATGDTYGVLTGFAARRGL